MENTPFEYHEHSFGGISKSSFWPLFGLVFSMEARLHYFDKLRHFRSSINKEGAFFSLVYNQSTFYCFYLNIEKRQKTVVLYDEVSFL